MVHSGTALIDPHVIFDKVRLVSGMRVADFGCGRTGHFVFPAACLVGDDGIVYAIDIIKNVLQSIKSLATSEGYNNVQTVWSDIELVGKTPIPAKSLDVCFFTNVLHQVKDRPSVIKEAARLLKKGGHLAIIEWKKKLGLLGPGHDQMVNPEKVINCAEENGLTFLLQSDISEYNYLLIFQKR